MQRVCCNGTQGAFDLVHAFFGAALRFLCVIALLPRSLSPWLPCTQAGCKRCAAFGPAAKCFRLFFPFSIFHFPCFPRAGWKRCPTFPAGWKRCAAVLLILLNGDCMA